MQERESTALDKLDWMVVCDLFETETAAFWKRPGVNPGSIGTEVFVLPGAAFYEKKGSVTNSGRLAQWKDQAGDPPGDARDELRNSRRPRGGNNTAVQRLRIRKDKPIKISIGLMTRASAVI